MTAKIVGPILIVVRGIPGSGKSYLAAALASALGEERVIVLDPDAIDYDSAEYAAHEKTLRHEAVDEALFPYRFLRERAYRAIGHGKIIIWNQPFTNLEIFKKMIGRLRDRAAECGTDLPVLVVEVELEPSMARTRVDSRKQDGGHGPSADTLSRRISDYRSFEDDGFQTLTIQGDDDIKASVSSVIQALTESQPRKN